MLDRRWRFAGLGALLGLGSPVGLIALRALQAGDLSPGFVASQLRADPLLFGYLAGASVAVLALFGHALGRQADRLDALGLTDALTGLGNRRCLQERLAHECARAARYGDSLALLLADLDGLKQVNDREGHRAGDALLSQVADVIVEGLRQVDLGARWGGDEFAVLAPRTETSEAVAMAERIRSDVARRTPATVSIGVAATGGAPLDAEALLRAADAGLYAAKQAGRNRVCLARGVEAFEP